YPKSCTSRVASPVAAASSRSIGYEISIGGAPAFLMAYPFVTFAPRVSQRNAGCNASCIGTTTASMPRCVRRLSRSESTVVRGWRFAVCGSRFAVRAGVDCEPQTANREPHKKGRHRAGQINHTKKVLQVPVDERLQFRLRH